MDTSTETCRWYVSIERPECGDTASDTVHVKGRTTNFDLSVCPTHKMVYDKIVRERARHNEAAARRRVLARRAGGAR